MLVLIDAERDVESISRKKLGFLYAFCHMPSQRIELKRAFPVRLGGICFLTVSRWRQLQLHVLFLEHTWRSHQADGAGLGLAIARWIAEAHGARIEIGSTPGSGTRVTISFPLFSDPLPKEPS